MSRNGHVWWREYLVGTDDAVQTGMRIRFDRGTVLFEESTCTPYVRGLPGVLWDPRVSAYRAPAYRYLEIIEELRREGVRFSDGVPGHRPISGRFDGIELRPYQLAALDAWELAGRRGLVVLPTGSGKTRTAIAAMARARTSTICLVPTRVLLDQWCRELSRMYGGRVGRLGDGKREVELITVSTFESAYRQMHQLGGRFGMMVVDEAHHFGGKTRDEALEMSIAGVRLGLTATPPTDGEGMASLTELLGSVVYELVIQDLTGRFLADFDLMTITVDLTPDERRRYDEQMAHFRPVFRQFRRTCPGANWTDFITAAYRTPEGRRAVDSWRRARRMLAYTHGKADALETLLRRHRAARVLVFTADNETAYAIAREHLIMPITCDIGRAEREDVLDRFKKGELRALVSARVLNEGLDVPAADVAIVVGGTQGQREHVQRVGRILRPATGKRALVFELVVRRTGEVFQARNRRKGLVSRQAAAVHV